MANRSDLKWEYDEASDILYLSFGDPVPAYGENLDDDIVLRHAIEDDAVVGLTVVGFRAMGGIDALIDRLNSLVQGLRIPLLTACAPELRANAEIGSGSG